MSYSFYYNLKKEEQPPSEASGNSELQPGEMLTTGKGEATG
jgi:hypothetical protein